MRFELGDTMVEGMEQTSALSDEEYNAILEAYPTKWKKAKLLCVESIMHRFAYEVDEKVGPLSLSLRERYEAWKELYDELEDEVASASVPSANRKAISGNHYFREGMHDNPNAGGTNTSLLKGGGRRFV
ncbi:MAG: hypothetical protein LUE24_03020 [Lachnospiraceae bacterium]|nr:hypothetical protein [Lachnospiraceae bacterium]MCD8196131.1 hypothetical protein [Lachnospiraceae bacterium]